MTRERHPRAGGAWRGIARVGAAALVGLALACGRYGPPVRSVSAADPQADAERFDGPLDEERATSRAEAVPYLLDGLLDEPEPLRDEGIDESGETPSGAQDPGRAPEKEKEQPSE